MTNTRAAEPTAGRGAPTAIGVLGVGAMGSRFVARLTDAGNDVTVWNRTEKASAELRDTHAVAVAATPRAAAEGADLVISMVTDDAASQSVWLDPTLGAFASMRDAVAIEMSTVTSGQAAALARSAQERGLGFLESPVIGSRPQAASGTLVALVGGDLDVLDHVRPQLAVIADTIRHIGPAGSAAVLKLAVNGLFGIQVAACAEIVGMLGRSAIDLKVANDVLRNLPITSPAMQRMLVLFDTATFDPNFPIRLVAKDLGYLVGLGEQLAADLPLSRTASAAYEQAAQGPAAELDIAGILTAYDAR